MNFTMSLITWVIVGGLIGWLARRSEPRQSDHSYPYVALGIVGGVLGGLLWFPEFFFTVYPQPQMGITYMQGISLIHLFEFITFNLFSVVFGFIAAFWVLHLGHLVRDRRLPLQS